MKSKQMIISSGIQTFLIFGILSINGCSTFGWIGNSRDDTGKSNFLLKNERIGLDTVQERIQHIRVALRQKKFTQARRLTEMVLLEVQWIEVTESSQKSKPLTALTQEAINEKKSKKFIA